MQSRSKPMHLKQKYSLLLLLLYIVTCFGKQHEAMSKNIFLPVCPKHPYSVPWPDDVLLKVDLPQQLTVLRELLQQTRVVACDEHVTESWIDGHSGWSFTDRPFRALCTGSGVHVHSVDQVKSVKYKTI